MNKTRIFTFMLVALLLLTGCKNKDSSASEDISEITLSEEVSEDPSSETSEGLSIDWLGGNSYYKSLDKSSDEIGDLARLLRNTIRFETYGDARYNYAVNSVTGFQYVIYETTGLNVPLSWGSGGYVDVPGHGQLKIEREHIWARRNMSIRPVDGSTAVDRFPKYELDTGSTFYGKGVNNNHRGHTTDWHNLWNSVGSWNGSHSNKFYGAPSLDFSQQHPGGIAGAKGWYPGREFVGDVARAVFYMSLVYPFMTLVDSNSSEREGSIYYGYLDYLLEWNRIDPVSPEEIDRNEKIFKAQKNRNPFIDYYDQDIATFVFEHGDPEIPQD